MFTFKTTTALKYVTAVALLALAACGKKDDAVTPEPEVLKDKYLIKTAVHTSELPYIDSITFSYNDKYQLKHIRYSAANDPMYFGSELLTYNDKGRIIFNTQFGKDDTAPNSYDSIVWDGQKATYYVRWASATTTIPDTSRYEYNSTGLPVSLRRRYISREYTYQNGDLVKLTSIDTWNTPNNKSEETYEYDSMPNPFYEMYLNNPLIDVISNDTYHKMLPSKHNVTKVTTTSGYEGGTTISHSEVYVNKYNATTGLLEEQSYDVRSSTKFTYIKVP